MVNLLIVVIPFLLTSILAIPFEDDNLIPISNYPHETTSSTMASVETKMAKASTSHSSEAIMDELEDKITLIIAAAKRSLETNTLKKKGAAAKRNVKSNAKSKRRMT